LDFNSPHSSIDLTDAAQGAAVLEALRRQLGGDRPQRHIAVMMLRSAKTIDFYDAMDRDITYPNLGLY